MLSSTMASTTTPPTTISQDTLRQRTRAFAIGVVQFCRQLGNGDEQRIIRNQLLRSGTSVGANYRSTCRAKSRREFTAKIGVVIEELDESLFWLEILASLNVGDPQMQGTLSDEANQLLSIFVVTRHHTRQRLKQK